MHKMATSLTQQQQRRKRLEVSSVKKIGNGWLLTVSGGHIAA
nr:hypothetical protein [Bradyrhizobium diazoefficiens]